MTKCQIQTLANRQCPPLAGAYTTACDFQVYF